MSQQVVQSGEVEARLVQRAQTSELGLVVDVLGTDWIPDRNRRPDHREGLAGEHGFQRGVFEAKRDEEGTLTITVPNTTGSDGRLHLERFEVLTRRKGKVPEGQEYHPGDEWLELYFDGEVETVVTPLGARLSGSEIELRCADVFWLLKRHRETQAGYWTPTAPRDVFENYCSAWQMVMAESFAGRGLVWSASEQTTADGRLAYLRAESVGETTVRLRAGTSSAQLQGGADLQETMYGGEGDYLPWRLEVAFTRPALLGTDAIFVGLGAPHGAPTDAFIYSVVLGETAAVARAGAEYLDLRHDSAPGRMTVAIEGRDRWVYFFIGDELRGVAPWTAAGGVMVPKIWTDADNLDVEYMSFRRARSYALRGADKGDYHLPGSPPVGGLDGQFFSEADTYSLAPAGQQYRYVLKPTKEAASKRRDPVIDFYGNPPAWAGGLVSQFSARWSGAIYLDLADRDLVLRTLADDRVRVWVGKTRRDEQLIDDWTAAGHTMTYTTSASLRAHLGLVNGWYPIVVEYSQDLAAGGIRLEISDAATPSMRWNVGGGSYRRELVADAPVALWGLGDLLAPERDYSANALDSTARANVTRIEGPIPGHQAYDFNGASSYVECTSAAALNPTAALSVEAWVRPDSITGTHTVLRKDGQYLLYTSGAQLGAALWVGGTPFALGSGNVMTVGEWQHVVLTGTDTGDVWKLYRNGVEVASGTRAGPLSTTANPLEIGRALIGAASSQWFDGAIAEVGLYSTALSAVRVLAHFEARQNVGSGQVSPLGCWQTDVRGDSHYEVIRQLIEQYGLQTRTEPRTLESGEFPGQLIPRVRVGRDTDKVLSAEEATDVSVDVSAEETADLLIGDAAGIAKEGVQLVVEEIDFERVLEHPLLSMEAESLSEMTIESNLRRRLASLLVLRAAPLEEVGARPATKREMVRPFLLSSASASELRWRPGDGARLRLPEVGVEDELPRALMSVSWPFVARGYGLPTVAWRQRPRNFKETLRRLQRRMMAPQRTFQGQLVRSAGSLGRHPAPTVVGGATDNFTRVGLPANASRVLEATFVVQAKSDASVMNVEVDSTNRLTFTVAGRYDITPWLASQGQRLYARATGGTGSAEYSLELLIAV